MGKFLIALSYFGYYGLDPMYQPAMEKTRLALISHPYFQDEMREINEMQDGLSRQTEIQFYNVTGLRSKDLVYAAYLYPIFTGSINTKPFKNIKYSNNGYNVRPELEYKFRGTQSLSINLVLTKAF